MGTGNLFSRRAMEIGIGVGCGLDLGGEEQECTDQGFRNYLYGVLCLVTDCREEKAIVRSRLCIYFRWW